MKYVNIIHNMIVRVMLCVLLSVGQSICAQSVGRESYVILQPTHDLMPLVGTRVMLQDREGYVWYGTVEGGLCRDNGYQIDVFRNDRHKTHRIGQSNGILSMCEDAKGNILFGTRKNLFVLDKRDYTIRQVDTALADGRVTSVACDGKGRIYVVSEHGRYCYDTDYVRIKYTGTGDTHGSWMRGDSCGFADCYGNAWSGGVGRENEIEIRNCKGMRRMPLSELPQMLPNVRMDFVQVDGGWLGHTNTEVFWTESIEKNPLNWHRVLTVGTRIGTLAVDKSGTLYVGDENGLYVVTYAAKQVTGKPRLIADTLGNIRKLVAAPSGGAYFVSARCELGYCDASGCVTVIKQGATSKALAVDVRGNVWTTNWFGDVFRYDRRSRKLKSVAEASIASGDPVNAMTCDCTGNLWMITDRTLHEYTADGRNRQISAADMPFVTGQFTDVFSTADGMVTVRCADAMLQIAPDHHSAYPFRLALTAVDVDGKVSYISNAGKVIISSDAVVVNMFFSTFNHVYANGVRFAYRVNGGEWHTLQAKDNHITFVNLQKGTYDIEVRATDYDGFWSKKTLHVSLVRLPAWWETWWAYVMYVLLFAAFVLLCDRLWQRYRAAKRKVAELQARLDEYLRREDLQVSDVAEQITDNSADREFIERAIELVEKNMSNSDFNIDDFCSELAVSRANLYRKFAAITGQKPTEFVRSIRLKRAAEMIKSGDHAISEIAYLCGFSSPSYFNRRFKEMFGKSPSEYT